MTRSMTYVRSTSDVEQVSDGEGATIVGPGELLSDAVSTHRGMAIKVLNVDGAKIDGHSGNTQDFVLATGPAFPQPDAAGFLKSMKGLESATSKSEGFKQTVSTD